MVFDVIARTNGAEGSFRAVAKEADGAAASFDKLGKAAAGITVAFGAFAVNAAVKFEQSMTRISTQAGVPIQQIKALGNAVLDLAPKVGVAPDALAQSLYHVESTFQKTGITQAKAIDLVKTAAEGAKIGGADLVDVTNALDAAVISGIPGVKNFQQAMGALNATVGVGDQTMQNLAEALGTGVLAVIKNYGVTLNDASAALAVFGDNNIRGAEAGTALRMAVQSLAVPAAKGNELLKGIGITSGQLARDMQQHGLIFALHDLVDQMNKAGITGAKIGDFLTQSFGKRAGVGLAVLVGQLHLVDEASKDVAKQAGTFASAWAHQQETAKQKLDDLKASWDVFLVRAGNAILPTLKRITDLLAKHPGILQAAAAGVGLLAAAWVGSKVAGAISAANKLARAILSIGTASTTAAAESEAAAGAGAAGAAEGAAAGGIFSRIGTKFPLLKIALPVAVTVGAIKVLGLQKSVDDMVRGQFGKAFSDSPEWTKALSGGLGKALNATGITGNAFTGNLSGTAIGKLANAPGYNESLKAVKADKAAIADFNKTLEQSNALLDNGSKSLTGNSLAAQANRTAIGLLVQKAKDGAEAEFRLTGKQSDYNAAIRLAIPAIENAATALGFNKQQVDNLIHSLGLVPLEKTTKVSVQGADVAELTLANIADTLARIPAQKLVDLQVIATGSATAAQIAVATAGGRGGFQQADGGIYTRGVPGGIVQWAEAGGEAFIPLSAAKRSRSLRLWAETGKLLGVHSMADGGIRTPQAVAPRGAPLMYVEHQYNSSPADVETALRHAEFRERVSRGFQ